MYFITIHQNSFHYILIRCVKTYNSGGMFCWFETWRADSPTYITYATRRRAEQSLTKGVTSRKECPWPLDLEILQGRVVVDSNCPNPNLPNLGVTSCTSKYWCRATGHAPGEPGSFN